MDHPILRPSLNSVKTTYDLMKKVKMQRMLGQQTAARFQRCVGMDAFNEVYSTTYEIDEKYGTKSRSPKGIRVSRELTEMHRSARRTSYMCSSGILLRDSSWKASAEGTKKPDRGMRLFRW